MRTWVTVPQFWKSWEISGSVRVFGTFPTYRVFWAMAAPRQTVLSVWRGASQSQWREGGGGEWRGVAGAGYLRYLG